MKKVVKVQKQKRYISNIKAEIKRLKALRNIMYRQGNKSLSVEYKIKKLQEVVQRSNALKLIPKNCIWN